MNDLYQYELGLKDLSITHEQLLLGMGYVDNSYPEYILPIIDQLIIEADELLKLKIGLKIIEHDIVIDSQNIILGGVKLTADKVITKHLKGTVSIAVFVVTAGKEYDDLIKNYYKKGDHITSYCADTLGSEIVESAADKLESFIAKIFPEKNYKCTNRLSPGYCNWDVADQHELFSLLPKNICGITLTDSALMIPIKSISGIIGIGTKVKKNDYQCNICNMKNCYKSKRMDKHL